MQVIAQDGVLLHREAALSAALAKPEQRNLCAQDVNVETATAVIPKHTAVAPRRDSSGEHKLRSVSTKILTVDEVQGCC